jgi:hypothetical protein
MRGLTNAEREMLETDIGLACGQPCGPTELDDASADSDDIAVATELVRRGLMVRAECATCFHFRNTPMGDLVLRVVQGC